MWPAVPDARAAAAGHEAVVVSHQLPIWVTRLKAEGRRFLHDPRKRQCTLCSLTSFTFEGDRLVSVGYSEPAGDLIPVADRSAPFSAGGADDDAMPHPGPAAPGPGLTVRSSVRTLLAVLLVGAVAAGLRWQRRHR